MEHIYIVKTGITELDVDCVVKNLHIVQSIDWHICNYKSRIYCEFLYDIRMVKLIIISTFVDNINVKRRRDISRFSFIQKNSKLHLCLKFDFDYNMC